MNVIELTVSKQKMTVRAPCTLVAGTVGLYGVKVTYDEEWDATPLRLVEFIGCADLKLQDTGGVIEIPPECIEKPCYLRFGLLGLDGNGKVRITTYSEQNCLEVVPADFKGEAESDEPLPPPTPSVYEQIITELEEVKQKSAYNALIYGDYATMVTSLNSMAKDSIGKGQNIFIVTLNVPDLWVSEVAAESANYEYVSDEQFVEDLADGTVQVGYFILSPLETQKVDLTDYVKKTDFAGGANAGVIKADSENGLSVVSGGQLIIIPPTTDKINNRNNGKPTSARTSVTLSMLDYAVMKALSDSKLEWTEEQKASALAQLGGLPKSTQAGVLLYGSSGGSTYMYTLQSDNPTPWSVPQRGLGGVVVVGTPTADSHATTKKYVDEGFVPITMPTDGYLYMYGQRVDGGSMTKVAPNEATPWTIVQRGANGVLKAGEPIADADATTKKYVDDGFVAKTTEADKVYCTNANGEQINVQWAIGAVANTIPRRDGDGRFYVPAPKFDSHVANKSYVDGLIADLQAQIDALKG